MDTLIYYKLSYELTKNSFKIMWPMTTAESTRAAGPLQQYLWLTLHIHTGDLLGPNSREK